MGVSRVYRDWGLQGFRVYRGLGVRVYGVWGVGLEGLEGLKGLNSRAYRVYRVYGF